MTVITIEHVGAGAEVRFPYDAAAVDVIRAAPARYFDRPNRCWHIPTAHVALVAEMFRRAGFDVIVIGTPAPPSSPRSSSPVEPVTALLALVPAHLMTPTIRALARVWHPDHGGSGDLMRRLNAARDAVAKR